MSTKLYNEIIEICKRPGMYFGPAGDFDLEKSYENFVTYVNGLFHGASLCTDISWASWNKWVLNQYPGKNYINWSDALYKELGSVQQIIDDLPNLYTKYSNEHVKNS
jgi:hypothetical protein